MLAFLLITNCIAPVKIEVPEGMMIFPELKVIGNDNSWKIDFGPYHVYNIRDTNERVLLTDAWYQTNEIISYEFTLQTGDNKKYHCYCEFPVETNDDKIFRGIYTNMENNFDNGNIVDSMLVANWGNIKIEPYYKSQNQKSDSKNRLMGYLFTDSEVGVGLTDIYNTNNESIWIDSSLNTSKQNHLAILSISYIIKHMKFSNYFFNKRVFEDPNDNKL